MASVIKRKESKFWTACYTSHDGRKLKRSTKSTDKNQALEIAINFERVEKQAKQGSLTSAQIKVPMHYNLLQHIHFISTFVTSGFLSPKLAGQNARGQARTVRSF